MRIILFVLAVLAGLSAFFSFASAVTAPQELFGGILLIVCAVLLAGAGIVDAIVALQKALIKM